MSNVLVPHLLPTAALLQGWSLLKQQLHRQMPAGAPHPRFFMGCQHQSLMFIMQLPMGDLGAQRSFIFSWKTESDAERREGEDGGCVC